MYVVELINNGVSTIIHDEDIKLKNGKVVKGINTIDSFNFTILPNNAGFYLINEFTTLVTVYNTSRERYEFIGRVLYAETTMDESGLITKTVTCENLFGYLCDSVQLYAITQNWTVSGLLQHLIDCHNSQVEGYKHFKLGTITVTDNNDNLYQAVQRENTWDSIKSKLLDKLGGELQFRVEEDGIYLDYLEKIGEEKQTEIALSVNMKAITREQDPTSIITRLIPLGAKITVDGEETEERIDVSEQNNGSIYIDDSDAIALYGVHVGLIEWDDVTSDAILASKGREWLLSNNKVQVKYSISALDLSLIGLAIDDFEVGNTYPIKNALIGIDDKARIIKKNIDVCEETKSTIEVGDNLKTLSDIQREQTEQIKSTSQSVQKVKQTSLGLAELNTKVSGLEKTFQEQIDLINDSLNNEWVALELAETFATYGGLEENVPMYKVTGNTVEVKGCVVPSEEFTSSAEKIVFASGLPEKLCPSFARSFICQGSEMNRWMLTVETDGRLTISRYGVTECVALPTTEGLAFNGTYMI